MHQFNSIIQDKKKLSESRPQKHFGAHLVVDGADGLVTDEALDMRSRGRGLLSQIPHRIRQ